MAYQIRYGQMVEKRMISNAKFSLHPHKRVLAFLCICALGAWLLSLESVRSFLIPGDDDITKSAFSVFTEQLRTGERFDEAASAFCREIIKSDPIGS